MKRINQADLPSFFPGGPSQSFGAFSNPWLGQGFVQNSLPLVGRYLFPELNMQGMKPVGAAGGKPVGGPQAPTSPQPGTVWEQIGGFDGIIDHMGKVQKIIRMTQSMSPLMKLFTQSTWTGTRGGRRQGRVPAVKAGSRLARGSRRLTGRMHDS